MSLKAGDIVTHKWARGSEKGFFRVIELTKGQAYWSKKEIDIAVCKLAAHDCGTVPTSKTLKERRYETGYLVKVTPETVAAAKKIEVAEAKRMVEEKAEVWDAVLSNLFPDSVTEKEEEEVEEGSIEDTFKELVGSGTGLLRPQE